MATKKLTKEQAIAEHRTMWSWIVDEMKKTGKYKTRNDYVKAFPEKRKTPLCDWVRAEYGEVACDKCPLYWRTSQFLTGYPQQMSNCKDHMSPLSDFYLAEMNPSMRDGTLISNNAFPKDIKQAEEMRDMQAR